MGTSKLPDLQLNFVQSIAVRVLLHYRDLPTVLGLEPFIPLTDLLHGPAQRDFFRRLMELVTGRGLHSFTSKLNLSAFYGIGGARRGCVAHVKGVLGGV